MAGLFNFGNMRQVDPMGASLGLMQLAQSFNNRPRISTNPADVSGPDDSMRNTLGLMQYQQQAQRQKMLQDQMARQAKLDEIKLQQTQTDAARRAKVADLIRQGRDPNDPEVRSAWADYDPSAALKSMAPGNDTSDIKEFQFAKSQGFNGSFEQWIQRKRQGAGEYGMQPIWGVDAQGRPAVLQLGKSGEAIQAKLPEGVSLARDPIRVDAGTHFVLLDPQTRQPVGSIAKDLKGEAAQKEAGKAQGEAQANLPVSEMNADTMLKMLDSLETHPGRSKATGAIVGRLPVMPGEAYDFNRRLEQVKGQSFLEAFKTLRGGGAITEVEGAKATDAINRLDRATTPAEFDSALTDLRTVVEKARAAQRQKAGSAAGGASPGMPKKGDVVDGWEFLGGDPGNQMNWRKR